MWKGLPTLGCLEFHKTKNTRESNWTLDASHPIKGSKSLETGSPKSVAGYQKAFLKEAGFKIIIKNNEKRRQVLGCSERQREEVKAGRQISKSWEAGKSSAGEGRSSNRVMIQGAALQRVLGKEVLNTPSCPNENRRHLEQLSVASEGQNEGMEPKCPAGSQEREST